MRPQPRPWRPERPSSASAFHSSWPSSRPPSRRPKPTSPTSFRSSSGAGSASRTAPRPSPTRRSCAGSRPGACRAFGPGVTHEGRVVGRRTRRPRPVCSVSSRTLSVSRAADCAGDHREGGAIGATSEGWQADRWSRRISTDRLEGSQCGLRLPISLRRQAIGHVAGVPWERGAPLTRIGPAKRIRAELPEPCRAGTTPASARQRRPPSSGWRACPSPPAPRRRRSSPYFEDRFRR